MRPAPADEIDRVRGDARMAMAASTAGPASPAPTVSGRGRAFGPGLRRASIAATVLIAAVVAVVALAAGHGAASAKLKYGGLPSWLPKSTFNPNEVLQASPRNPVLAIQGNTVSVNLAGGRVLAKMVGPTVPEDGR